MYIQMLFQFYDYPPCTVGLMGQVIFKVLDYLVLYIAHCCFNNYFTSLRIPGEDIVLISTSSSSKLGACAWYRPWSTMII